MSVLGTPKLASISKPFSSTFLRLVSVGFLQTLQFPGYRPKTLNSKLCVGSSAWWTCENLITYSAYNSPMTTWIGCSSLKPLAAGAVVTVKGWMGEEKTTFLLGVPVSHCMYITTDWLPASHTSAAFNQFTDINLVLSCYYMMISIQWDAEFRK